MIEKLFISLNWVIGSLAIGFCLVSGNLIGEGGLGTDAVRKTMVAAVEAVAKYQGGRRDTSISGAYVTFSRNPAEMKKALGGISLPRGDFTLEAFFEGSGTGKNNLVIRAIATANSVRNGRAQPLIYQKILPVDGGEIRNEWVPLSNKPYGLKVF